MKKRQKKKLIKRIQDQLAQTPNDPNLTITCHSFDFCLRCKEFSPCKCGEV
jgi:uncharacterized protein HemY